MAVRFTAEEIRAKYETVAPMYDRQVGMLERLGLTRMRRRLLRLAKGRVLEVAVGTGKNLSHYPAGCEITAVDLSPAMLDRARQRAEQLGIAVDLQVQNAEALAFADATFDTVLSTLSLCTFPDPVVALREMARVCKPNGQILLLEHGRSDREWMGRVQDRWADRNAMMMGCHINRRPLDLIAEAGLDAQQVQQHLLGILLLMQVQPSGATTRTI